MPDDRAGELLVRAIERMTDAVDNQATRIDGISDRVATELGEVKTALARLEKSIDALRSPDASIAGVSAPPVYPKVENWLDSTLSTKTGQSAFIAVLLAIASVLGGSVGELRDALRSSDDTDAALRELIQALKESQDEDHNAP